MMAMTDGEWFKTLAERLFEQRVVVLHGALDDAVASRVSAELMTLDAEGDGPVTLRIDSADGSVAFQISGPGAVVAVDNADNASHEPFQASSRRAYEGRCIAVIRATAARGKITVSASSAGLVAGSVTIEAVSK